MISIMNDIKMRIKPSLNDLILTVIFAWSVSDLQQLPIIVRIHCIGESMNTERSLYSFMDFLPFILVKISYLEIKKGLLMQKCNSSGDIRVLL